MCLADDFNQSESGYGRLLMMFLMSLWMKASAKRIKPKVYITFTFMHLTDAFIQSNLQCIQAIPFLFSVCSLGIEPTTF